MKKIFLSTVLLLFISNIFSQIFLYKSQSDWENGIAEEYNEYCYEFGANEYRYTCMTKGDEKIKLEKNKYWAVAEPKENKIYRIYKWDDGKRADECLLIHSGEKFYVYILGSATYNEGKNTIEYSFEDVYCSKGFAGKLYRARDFDKELKQYKDDLKGCGAIELKCILQAAGSPKEEE
ncbi:MAG: hypothetical protein H7Y00_10805 [Fimbriimonadaceae bacterium]|nr:hypothetical protein [Chitinophagales bacterium]